VRTIDFEDKVITNDYMRVNEKGQGIGLFLLINQIKSAQQFDFIKLDVHAAGGEGWTSDWDGYFY